jgi:hypothetical protein
MLSRVFQFVYQIGYLKVTLAALTPLSILYIIGLAMRLRANHLIKKLDPRVYIPMPKQGFFMEYIFGPLVLPMMAFMFIDEHCKGKNGHFHFTPLLRSVLILPLALIAKFVGLFTIGLLYLAYGGLFAIVILAAIPALMGRLFGF